MKEGASMSILMQLDTPIFYAEKMPDITRENFTLIVDGLIQEEIVIFTFEQIENMPVTTSDVRLTSVSGWSVRAKWQGTLFSDLIKNFTVSPKSNYVNFTSFGNYSTCIPLDELLKDNVLLCYKVNGQYLEQEYGAPLRLIVPQLWGYKSIKGLSKITFTDTYIRGYWESRGYPDKADIEPGFTMDVNSGEIKKINGGEVTDF
jgi:DMSO/TMAO reductase YedYZ molybdopterin-dependent catalytic subunit